MQTCRIVIPPGDACGKKATQIVTFTDDDKVPACATCALEMNERAKSHGTLVRVEAIEP